MLLDLAKERLDKYQQKIKEAKLYQKLSLTEYIIPPYKLDHWNHEVKVAQDNLKRLQVVDYYKPIKMVLENKDLLKYILSKVRSVNRTQYKRVCKKWQEALAGPIRVQNYDLDFRILGLLNQILFTDISKYIIQQHLDIFGDYDDVLPDTAGITLVGNYTYYDISSSLIEDSSFEPSTKLKQIEKMDNPEQYIVAYYIAKQIATVFKNKAERALQVHQFHQQDQIYLTLENLDPIIINQICYYFNQLGVKYRRWNVLLGCKIRHY